MLLATNLRQGIDGDIEDLEYVFKTCLATTHVKRLLMFDLQII